MAHLFLQIAMWCAAVANVLLSFRSITVIRTNRAMRQIIFAYEKDLQERGVTLPPRCVYCCQILPRHVEGCDFEEFYLMGHKLTEYLTRPPIEYHRDGSQPPHYGGKVR